MAPFAKPTVFQQADLRRPRTQCCMLKDLLRYHWYHWYRINGQTAKGGLKWLFGVPDRAYVFSKFSSSAFCKNQIADKHPRVLASPWNVHHKILSSATRLLSGVNGSAFTTPTPFPSSFNVFKRLCSSEGSEGSLRGFKEREVTQYAGRITAYTYTMDILLRFQNP